MTEGDERRRLVERAFGPEGTAVERAALVAYDRARTAEAPLADPEPIDDVADALPGVPEGVLAPRRVLHRPVIVAIAAVLLVGAGAAGWALGHRSAAPPPTPAAAAAQARLEQVQTTLPAFPEPEEFSSPQARSDVPTVPLPSNLVESTFRLEQGPQGTTMPKGSRLYIAEDTNRYDCLVAVHGTSVDSACVSPDYFPASGLVLSWIDDGTTVSVTWQLDGSLTFSTD